MNPANYPVKLELTLTRWESLSQLVEFLRAVRDSANGGHSFRIEADRADLGDECPYVSVDGDGNDHIGQIFLDGKNVTEGTFKSRPGSRQNPIAIRKPGDLAAATRDMPQPTPGQAKVDNYRLGHVLVAGIPVAIETPKGTYRFGRNPHGARWHVIMLADYGYFPGTKDEDGEGVDVYLGPDSYRAAELSVWIIDQRHAHSRKWDEHKVMLGFADLATVRTTYYGGFSDGLGPKRVGAVTRMTFEQFKTWLEFGDKKKPLAYRRRSSPLDKSRADAVVVATAEDLERATQNYEEPTPARAMAGNYRMAHVVIGGLDVSIETPKDRKRYGTDADGSRWEVTMPAHYGYVKQTEGADGDHVDVYLGPESHRVTELPVWIVDQRDADTGDWDEHKVMLGFPDTKTAHETYVAGFSDGKGQQRIGACTRFAFSDFTNWLKNGDTSSPITYRTKSASRKSNTPSYGAETCQCSACRGTHGGTMTQPASPVVSAASEPKALGFAAKLMSTVMSRLSPAERDDFLKDASLMADTALGKATDLLEHGDDHGGHPGIVEDLWSGPADDHLEVGGGSGPGSKAPPGKVNVGPSQEASGDGAVRMERHYSNHSPQGGVQRATEMLGSDLVAMKGAVRSVVGAVKAMQTQIEMLKAGSTAPTGLDEAAVQAIVGKAIGGIDLTDTIRRAVKKAISKAMPAQQIVAKSFAELPVAEALVKAQAFVAKAGDADKEPEKDEAEDEWRKDDDKEEGEGKSRALQAAGLRVQAKARVRQARQCLEMAQPLVAKADYAEIVAVLSKAAKRHLKAAAACAEKSKSIMGKETTRYAKVVKSIGKVRKARHSMPAAQSQNQTIWPNSNDEGQGVGNGAAPGAQDLAKAADNIARAAAGMGMMTATVQELVNAMSARTVAVTETGERLPPVYALAKGGDRSMAVEQELTKMVNEGTIRFEDADGARDVLNSVRMNLPLDLVQAKTNRLPKPVQDLFQRQAA